MPPTCPGTKVLATLAIAPDLAAETRRPKVRKPRDHPSISDETHVDMVCILRRRPTPGPWPGLGG